MHVMLWATTFFIQHVRGKGKAKRPHLKESLLLCNGKVRKTNAYFLRLWLWDSFTVNLHKMQESRVVLEVSGIVEFFQCMTLLHSPSPTVRAWTNHAQFRLGTTQRQLLKWASNGMCHHYDSHCNSHCNDSSSGQKNLQNLIHAFMQQIKTSDMHLWSSGSTDAVRKIV